MSRGPRGATVNRMAEVPPQILPWDDPANLRTPAPGIVARDITIGATAPTNVTVQEVMMAGGQNTTTGTFSAANYNTRAPGTLNVIGWIIQKYRGAVGVSSNGVLTAGYNKNYVYDHRMAVMPPPFFPTTGTFRRVSAGPCP